jgi:hypothetical protein
LVSVITAEKSFMGSFLPGHQAEPTEIDRADIMQAVERATDPSAVRHGKTRFRLRPGSASAGQALRTAGFHA